MLFYSDYVCGIRIVLSPYLFVFSLMALSNHTGFDVHLYRFPLIFYVAF